MGERQGQYRTGIALMEYVFLILIFLMGMYVFAVYIRNGYQGQIRKSGETFGFLRQYDPKTTHDCVYEAEIRWSDGKTTADVFYSRACWENWIVQHRCIEKADSAGCMNLGKVCCMETYACSSGGTGVPTTADCSD
jgi:hypothetical protein